MRCSGSFARDNRIATFEGVWYVLDARNAEGWLSGLKRRFAKPLYGIKACTEGSNPSPSAKFIVAKQDGERLARRSGASSVLVDDEGAESEQHEDAGFRNDADLVQGAAVEDQDVVAGTEHTEADTC